MAAGITGNLDGPPPSPATDPMAAQEGGASPDAVAGLVAGRVPGVPQGPDMSGLMMLGNKLDEGLLTLATAAPLIGPDIEQIRAMLANAMGRFAAQSGGEGGMGGRMPAPPPVTQAGPQFPGSTSAGRPF